MLSFVSFSNSASETGSDILLLFFFRYIFFLRDFDGSCDQGFLAIVINTHKILDFLHVELCLDVKYIYFISCLKRTFVTIISSA